MNEGKVEIQKTEGMEAIESIDRTAERLSEVLNRLAGKIGPILSEEEQPENSCGAIPTLAPFFQEIRRGVSRMNCDIDALE